MWQVTKREGGEGFPLQFLPQAADFHLYIIIILTREGCDYWQVTKSGVERASLSSSFHKRPISIGMWKLFLTREGCDYWQVTKSGAERASLSSSFHKRSISKLVCENCFWQVKNMIISKSQRERVERASLSCSFHKRPISIVSIAGRSFPPHKRVMFTSHDGVDDYHKWIWVVFNNFELSLCRGRHPWRLEPSSRGVMISFLKSLTIQRTPSLFSEINFHILRQGMQLIMLFG